MRLTVAGSVACLAAASVVGVIAAGCGGVGGASEANAVQPAVLVDTSYLADIAQNVAGSRLEVTSLLPIGADPHSFEPTPRDARKVAESRAVIINTPGLEPLVDALIKSAGRPDLVVIEAAAGLSGRIPQAGEVAAGADDHGLEDSAGEIDPHFWLDPLKVITYVENIEKGLSVIDPEGAETYRLNGEAYVRRLRDLDTWITGQVAGVPLPRRLLVTNHESLGYFADRYGFRIVGTVFPTLGVEGTPSAKQLAALVEKIRATRAPAIFLETGSTGDLARQVARETGTEVVTDLYTHSLGAHASTYLDMMRWNVNLIVEALR
ncbi:MAG: metal ABC transporter substrate-binding protein [bacterium]